MVPTHDIDIRPQLLVNGSSDLTIWVRMMLLAIAMGLVALFVVAERINPYDSDGHSLRIGTHRQLGLPPCQFMLLFGRPCPHCGMTTSFALLVRGDLFGSIHANFVGTLLAALSVVGIVWLLACITRRRWVYFRPTEKYVLWGIVGVIGLAFVRWMIVVGWPWLNGYG